MKEYICKSSTVKVFVKASGWIRRLLPPLLVAKRS